MSIVVTLRNHSKDGKRGSVTYRSIVDPVSHPSFLLKKEIKKQHKQSQPFFDLRSNGLNIWSLPVICARTQRAHKSFRSNQRKQSGAYHR